jgi:hypothetical protein
VAAERIALVKTLTREAGRNPDRLRLLWPVFASTPLDDMKRAREAGINEFYLVMTGSLPLAEGELDARMAELGRQFVDAARDW